MPADDWMLAQGTVDFRNEERRERNEAIPEPCQLSLLEPVTTAYQRGETAQLGPDDDDWGGF